MYKTNNTKKIEYFARQQKTATEAYIRQFFGGLDLAEIEAKLHVPRMLQVLARIAEDERNPLSMRRACANDVLAHGLGRPVQRTYVIPRTVEQVEARMPVLGAENAAEMDMTLDDAREKIQRLHESAFHLNNTPVEQWPDWMKESVGTEGLSAYKSLEADE